MKSALIATSLLLGLVTAPAFAGSGYGNGPYGPAQVTSYSAPVSSAKAADTQKTRAEVKAELKQYRDQGEPGKSVYFGQ